MTRPREALTDLEAFTGLDLQGFDPQSTWPRVADTFWGFTSPSDTPHYGQAIEPGGRGFCPIVPGQRRACLDLGKRARKEGNRMKAVWWNGINNVVVEDVPDPTLINPRDAIIQVTSTAICGSDLHLYDGYVPTMMKGDILGHEFMGEVMEVGSGVKNLKVGDRVVVPFPISCGNCYFCKNGMWALCDNLNPKASLAETMYGHAPAGIFGYSHLMGGYSGGQAEYVRVPFADVGPFKIENGDAQRPAADSSITQTAKPAGRWVETSSASINP